MTGEGYQAISLALALSLGLLAVIGIRLLVLALRKPKRQPAQPRDLLLDALKEQSEREQSALQHQQQTTLAYEALDALYSTVVNNMPVGLAVLDAKMRLEFANPVFMQFFDLEQVTGQTLGTVNPLLGEAVALMMMHSDERVLTLETQTRSLRVRLKLVPMEHRFLLTAGDETRIYQMEQQLRIKRDLELMGEMAGGVTHEVKNTLATISGLVQLIPHGDVTDTTARLEAEVDRLNQFIRAFTSVGKKGALNKEHLDPVQVYAEEQTRLEQLPHGDRVAFEPQPTGLLLFADKLHLEMVLDNLIRNGLESCAAQPPQQPVWVTVSLEEKAEAVLLCVSDHGPGFPAHMREKLFTPFVSDKAGGTGLGLFQCRKVMLQHGGDLDVLHQPHTRMVCRFPKADDDADHQPPSTA